jgi:hypothetical protein
MSIFVIANVLSVSVTDNYNSHLSRQTRHPPKDLFIRLDGGIIFESRRTGYSDCPRSCSLCWVAIPINNTCYEKTSERSDKTAEVDGNLFTPGTCALLILFYCFGTLLKF